MIACARRWSGGELPEASRIARSLGLFAGNPADVETTPFGIYARLAHPRASRSRGWRAARTASGAAVLLHGWIDNATELAGLLGTSVEDVAKLYGAAVDRWGDEADQHIIGSYAAIVGWPDQRIRLARSPWSGPPLAYANDSGCAMVASVSRVIFAAGHPERLRRDKLAATIAMQIGTDEESMFEGVHQVPHGSVVHLNPAGARLLRWYDPCTLQPVHLPRDADYVERGVALLDEAVGCALRPSKKPGVELSGGLDSALMCDRVLNALPEQQRLPSFTFHPIASADLGGRQTEDDERHLVRSFAAMHPRLDPVFVDNRGAGYDARAREMFLAAGKVLPAMILLMPRHGVLQAARDHGCDWLFGADYGNLNVSNPAAWAMPEFLMRGRWGQAWKLARATASAKRPAWRQLVSLGLMPQLSPAARAAVRRFMRLDRQAHIFSNRLLRPHILAEHGLVGDDRSTNISTNGEFVASRDQWLYENYASLGLGAEMFLALEQVFGMQRRDVTAYRPLTEFCLSVPTDQLVRDGTSRFLARRMGMGRMPESQRNRVGHAIHNADWHARMTPHIAELRAAVEGMGRQPDLAGMIDIDAAMHLLDCWPDRPPDPREQGALFATLQFHLPATLFISQFVDFVSGRNAN